MTAEKQSPQPGIHSYGALEAFKQRRQLFINVQEVQKLEHEAIKRIASTTAAGKKELLRVLSSWLIEQTVCGPEHIEVESLTGCRIQDWVALQSESVRLNSELERSEAEVRTANARRKSVAPLGVLNEWLAKEPQKTTIRELTNTLKAKDAVRNEAVRRVTCTHN